MTFSIALSGGGARGAAHVGVLQALRQAGLRPNILAGASAGALIAGLYAAGLSPDELCEEIHRLSVRGKKLLDWDNKGMALLAPRFLLGGEACFSGLIKGDRLEKYLRRITGGMALGEVKCPVILPAVDLRSGETIVFSNLKPPNQSGSVYARGNSPVKWTAAARLSEAMAASAAFPGLFRPRSIGAYSLIDGGTTQNLPADLLLAAGAERVLAVDVSKHYRPAPPCGIPDVLSAALTIMGDALENCSAREERYRLTPQLPEKANLLSFSQMPACVEAGYREAKAHLREIRAALNA